MTEPQKIKITVTPGKGIKIEPINFKGSSCLEASKALLDMGESTTELKQEFYEPDVEINNDVNIDL